MKTIAIIPAYNEASHVGDVIRATLEYVDEVLVVDDGSSDETAAESEAAGASVYRHIINRGVGGATATGLRAAVQRGAEIIVTLDSDGQHLPSEIPQVIAPIIEGTADFVIGCRLLDPTGMPWSRQMANRAADLCTSILFNVQVHDSQCGFRAFTREAADKIDIRTGRYEISSEIIAEIAARGFRIAEVPITVVYTPYSLSKGQGLGVGLQTLAKLVMRKAA